ncbi:hypothetical protein [Flavobacterium hungaricum]|uniref:Uncharacterized protein n=1 Tax=Flavobacterium hungaricum TaxID=2082725 RepID=A0ABR9TML2_9FLAO|nr:hypothetical protein [Flavobacterium hungaricum]MBE8726486.1 hypothetical protein [Flavobacterium hungaricum]
MENNDFFLAFDFFVSFPGGYRIKDITNGNTDVYIVLKSDFSKVYIATVFTLENIKTILRNNNQKWFWAQDLLVVKDLSRETIYQSIDEIMRDESLDVNLIFSVANKTYLEIVGSDKIREDLL